MKIALITDTHFGVYKASKVFLESQLKFFKEQLFPELKKQGVTTIIHAGDVFDNRVHLHLKVQNAIHEMLTNEGLDFDWYMIVGNHCSYYKSNIEINSLKQFQTLPNVTVIQDIEKISFDGRDILLVPWQVDDKKFIKRVNDKNLDCEVCIGHFETTGFYLNKGKVCDSGVDSDLFFDNFKVTFSGHFHKRHIKKKGDSVIQYIGNTYHITRHDIGEDRGYVIFDTDTLKYDFHNNTKSLKFVKLSYPERLNKKLINGNIVDVYVKLDDNYNETNFQQYLHRIEKNDPIMPPVVKITNTFDASVKINDYKVQTVHDLIQEYVGALDIGHKKDVTKKLIELYNECKQNI